MDAVIGNYQIYLKGKKLKLFCDILTSKKKDVYLLAISNKVL